MIRTTQDLTDSEWEQYEDIGYVRLGSVVSVEEIDALCERIDEIMLGTVKYEGMRMQLCPSAIGKTDGTRMTSGVQESTLKYRKIQELEMDPLFRSYMQHTLFRNIAGRLIGERVSIFRALFFNKPARGGVPLVWHQDGRFWNLDRYPEMTIYTALDAAIKKNGCVQVVPYSHRECPLHTLDSEEDIAAYAPPEKRHYLEMEKGEVVMFKTKLLHSSLVNTTSKPRRAFSIGFVHADSFNVKTGQKYPQILPEYEPVEMVSAADGDDY